MAVRWDICQFNVLDSTQDSVKHAAVDGVSEGLVIQALEQSAGRGRHGRVWVSQPGNLFLSCLFRPMCDAQHIGFLSLMVGVAVYKAAVELGETTEALMLKWPNDVLLNGQKCAGILLESDVSADGQIEWVAAGVGVNIVSSPDDEGVALNIDVEVDVFRDCFLKHLQDMYGLFQKDDFGSIIKEWLAVGHSEGTDLTVKIGKEHVQGCFDGLDADGNLILGLGAGAQRIISAGEVYLGKD